MAELVLGIGTSHSPQLSVSWEGWAMRGEADKGNPALIGTDGIVSGYDELLARADVTRIAREITDDKFRKRFEENQRAIAQIAEVIAKASLDVLVMIGDDQHEYLLDDNMPGVCIYWGNQVLVKKGPPPSPRNGNRPLIGYSDQDRVAPTNPALGKHLIEHLVESEFDVARMESMPRVDVLYVMTGVRPDLLLDITVRDFYHDVVAKPAVVHVELASELIDWRSRSLFAHHTFNVSAPVRTDDAKGAADAFNRAVTEALDALVPWVEEEAAKAPAPG